MKKISLAIFLLYYFPVLSQELSVSYTNAATAINTLVGSTGVTISNPVFSGEAPQLGLVTSGSSAIGFSSGIILTTGDAAFAHSGNTSDTGGDIPVTMGAVTDPDLSLLMGGGAQKAPVVLEFDFTTTGAHPSFQYVFLSDEYNNYAPSDYHDGFGFFISGPGISGPYSNGAINIANVPGTTTAVSVNTINSCTNSGYYRNNCFLGSGGGCVSQQGGNALCTASGSSLNNHLIPYNGLTTVLQATTTLDCNLLAGATYHCKIVLSNIRDDKYDSAVILKAGSLTSDFHIGAVTAFPQPVCEGQALTLTVAGGSSYNYSWSTGQSGAGLTSVTTASAAGANPYSVTATNADGCQITQSINAIVHTPANIAPYVNGINNTGNYIFYAQAGQPACFYVPTFDTPGENVTFDPSSSVGLPSGATFISTGSGQEIGQFCWTPSLSAIGDHTFTVNFYDNNACVFLTNSATFIVRIGCGSCVPNVYYENREPSVNPLPAFTKAGYAIVAGENVDPLQTNGPVSTGSATVDFKAGVQILLEPGFTAGPGFTAVIDPNTCITDCEDCCSHFPGITYDFIPNIFTPNGDGINETWYVPDHNYPFCAYNAQAFNLQVFNLWGDRVYNRAISSSSCCPFRAKSNNSDPTIPSISWNGIASQDVSYNFFEQLLGKIEAHNGQQVSDGTYYYTLTIAGCGTSVNLNGYMMVLGNNDRVLIPAPEPDSTAGSTALRMFPTGITTGQDVSSAELLLYPNPANTEISIVMNDENFSGFFCTLEVYNYQGQITIKKECNINAINVLELGMLKNGLYTVKIAYGKKVFIKTFVKLE